MTEGKPSLRVLLVEDNLGDAELITDYLATVDGYYSGVVHVESLRSAAKSLSVAPCDIVLLDLQLPDASGVACVKSLTAINGEVPIIVLTGMEQEALALECVEAGAQDYIYKNELRPGNLRRSIDYAMARMHERNERLRADALQQHLAGIVEASNDAIVSTTLDGIVTSWNSGAEKIFGFAASEALDKHVIKVIRATNDKEVDKQFERLIALKDNTAPAEAIEIVRLRKDDTPINLSAVSFALKGVDGKINSFAGIFRDVTELKRRDEELRLRNLELQARDIKMRALTGRLNAVREEERTRISRTVHDELGQLLTGINIDLSFIAKRLAKHSPEDGLLERIHDASDLTDRLASSVQRIAIELRPSALDSLGLASAIRDEARRYQERTGVAHIVEVATDLRPSPEVATQLFRICQELLTNIARHAKADMVNVLFESEKDIWILRVADNGVGIDLGAETRASSLGLLGIRERAEMLGGTVNVERGTERGTVATIKIPSKSVPE